MFKKTTLKNGLRIITVPQKESQAVTVLVLVGTGSKYETKDINGISHFLEHMFFKGTKKKPNTIAVSEPLDKIGGIYNAFTGEEETGYFAKVDYSRLDLALEWVADIFLNSKLDNEEVQREKGVITEEINMRVDHPSSYVQILWSRLLYGDQPAGWDIAGTKESVASISQSALMQYMKNQYVASNTIVCVAGRINEKEVITKVKKYFVKIPAGDYLKKIPVIEKQDRPQLLLHERKTDQSHICLGARGYNLFHPRKYAQDILAVILGGMMSSRLFIKVRERLGLAYYIHTDIYSDPDTGFLMTQAGLHNNKIEDGILAILKEYKTISEIPVPAKELQKAKDYIKGKTALMLESSDAKASFFAVQELLERKILSPEEIYAKINKVSGKEILEVARDIFQPTKLNLALIGPYTEEEKFQKLFES